MDEIPTLTDPAPLFHPPPPPTRETQTVTQSIILERPRNLTEFLQRVQRGPRIFVWQIQHQRRETFGEDIYERKARRARWLPRLNSSSSSPRGPTPPVPVRRCRA